MKLVTGPRQSGKTRAILKWIRKHGSATIVVARQMDVQIVKARVKESLLMTDISVITFREYCRGVLSGKRYGNVYIDDIDVCIDALNGNMDTVTATVAMESIQPVCEVE